MTHAFAQKADNPENQRDTNVAQFQMLLNSCFSLFLSFCLRPHSIGMIKVIIHHRSSNIFRPNQFGLLLYIAPTLAIALPHMHTS